MMMMDIKDIKTENIFADSLAFAGGCGEMLLPPHANTEPVLSDDIWNKFELDFPELASVEEMFKELEDTVSSEHHSLYSLLGDVCEIRNHDCMWAGHCASKEHPADEQPRQPMLVPSPPTPAVCTNNNNNNNSSIKKQQPPVAAVTRLPPPPSAPIKPPTQVQGGQSLLKTAYRVTNPRTVLPMPHQPPKQQQQPAFVVHTPQTPPMSDDEEGKTKNTDLARFLQETILASDDLSSIVNVDEEIMKNFSFDDDEDEEEEEEEDDDEEEDEDEVEQRLKQQQQQQQHQQQQQVVVRKPEPKYTVPTYAADHSYHKGKNSYVLDTPSDSEEEEIDVVSVEKSFNRMPSSLPTNPSTRDRQQLQRRMATAITRQRMTAATLKTMGPMKKTAADGSTTMTATTTTTTTLKRRMPESSGSSGSSTSSSGSAAAAARGIKRTKQYHRMAPAAAAAVATAAGGAYKRRHVYGNSSDSEPEPSEKRSLHNNMERQRRIDLRNAFEDLRLLVPEVSKKERAAKVVILREAAQYCHHLGKVSQGYTKQSEDLRRQQEWLRQRVSQLRRSLAAKR